MRRIVLGTALLAVLLLIIIFFASRTTQPEAPSGNLSGGTSSETPISPTPRWGILSIAPTGEAPKEKGLKEEASQEQLPTVTKIHKEDAEAPKESPSRSQERAPQKTTDPSDPFEKLYPASYRATLELWKGEMLKRNYPVEKFTFQAEAEIIDFMKLFIKFNQDLGLISHEEETELTTSLTTGTFHTAKEVERASLGSIKEQVSSSFKTLLSRLLPNKAYAALFVTLPPLCYKNLGPASKGVALPAPTCNSGLNATGVPIPDCGPINGTLCQVPLGCLNAVCALSPNAIYDRIGGICGCG